jgi:hypothetical protein
VYVNHEKPMQKKIVPASHPLKNARFQERRCQAQNSAAAPSGASQACPLFGKANASAIAPSTAAPSSAARTEVPMLRKLIFAVSVLALTLTSCGRQVTPNRNSGTSGQFGLPAGYMQIKFTVQGQLDFSNNWYVLAFNTSGTGGEPYAVYGNQSQNWKDWWAEIIVFQPPGGQVEAFMYQFITQQGTGSLKSPYNITSRINPQQLQVNPNCNGLGTQFCVTVDRHIFIPVTATPAPGASPTATPTGAPSPTPTPATGTAATWFVNWFVASPSAGNNAPFGSVLSAPGVLGPQDTSFQYKVDTTTAVDTTPWLAQAGWATGPTPSGTVGGGEILNNP